MRWIVSFLSGWRDEKVALRRALLWAEMAFVFGFLPVAFAALHITRPMIHGCMWVMTALSLVFLYRQSGFSWRGLWEGAGWSHAGRRRALARYLALVPILIALTLWIAPDRFLQFPAERPGFWLIVMLLYPLLSVVPQEIVFRAFFFQRYATAAPNALALVVLSGLCFGFVHILFHNWVSPVMSALGGILFAASYAEHRSLKWAVIEHALYGNTVFTLGLGWYFVRTVWN